MTFKQVTSHHYPFRTNVPSMQRNIITIFFAVGHYFIRLMYPLNMQSDYIYIYTYMYAYMLA